LCKHTKNCTHKCHNYGVISYFSKYMVIFYLFWTLFWPIFALWLYLGSNSYILVSQMVYLWTFFNFYYFLSYFGPFFTIDFHIRIYILCKYAKNCTHKWYFYENFLILPFILPILDPFLTLYWPFVIFGVKLI